MMAVFLQVSLLYANVSPDDILLKQKLDILATSHPNLKVQLFQYVKAIAVLSKFHVVFKQLWLICYDKKTQVFYTVDNPSKNWRGGTGYISKDMVVKGLPGPSDDTLILVSVTLLLQHLNFHMLMYLIRIWHQVKCKCVCVYIYIYIYVYMLVRTSKSGKKKYKKSTPIRLERIHGADPISWN
jgi:NAD(P)H-flavin reductase